jgi:hypothetical protein
MSVGEPACGKLCAPGFGVLPAFPHSLTRPGMANAWQKSSASARKKVGSRQDTVALGFKSLGHEDWFYYYLTCMIGISLVVYLFMRDTKADSAMHRHE